MTEPQTPLTSVEIAAVAMTLVHPLAPDVLVEFIEAVGEGGGRTWAEEWWGMEVPCHEFSMPTEAEAIAWMAEPGDDLCPQCSAGGHRHD